MFASVGRLAKLYTENQDLILVFFLLFLWLRYKDSKRTKQNSLHHFYKRTLDLMTLKRVMKLVKVAQKISSVSLPRQLLYFQIKSNESKTQTTKILVF